MFDTTYRVTGRISAAELGDAGGKYRVELWDRDRFKDDWLAQTTTDDGEFTVEFDASRFVELGLDRAPDLYVRVFDGDRILFSTRSNPVSDADGTERGDAVVVDLGEISRTGRTPPDPDRPPAESPRETATWADAADLRPDDDGYPVDDLDGAGPYLVRLTLESLSIPADDDAWRPDCRFAFHSAVRTAGDDRTRYTRHPAGGTIVGSGDDVALNVPLASRPLGAETPA